jgi:hypothetical protein
MFSVCDAAPMKNVRCSNRRCDADFPSCNQYEAGRGDPGDAGRHDATSDGATSEGAPREGG